MFKKIVFCVRSMEMVGGKERAVAKIANALTSHYQVGILSLGGKTTSFYTLDPKIQKDHLNTLSFLGKRKSLASLLLFFRGIGALARFLRQEKPDVVIGSDFLINIQLILAQRYSRQKVNVIGWEHLTLEDPIMLSRKFLVRLRNLFYKRLLALVVITPSDMAYSKKQGFYTHLIPYPKSFTFDGTIDYTQKRILTIARLSHQKGLDLYLELIHSMRRDLNGWKFLLVGKEDDILLKELQEQIEQYEIQHHLEIKSPQADVIQLYACASIYLLTSRYEGLPITLIEAQSCGLPIVSFDCKTGPSDIITHGQDGFIIPTFDVTEMRKQLLHLMNDGALRKQMGEQAKKSSERFDENKIINRWITFINGILEK